MSIRLSVWHACVRQNKIDTKTEYHDWKELQLRQNIFWWKYFISIIIICWFHEVVDREAREVTASTRCSYDFGEETILVLVTSVCASFVLAP